MIRLAGLACLVLCGGGAGWYAAMGLQRTRTAAECLSRMLREMAVQMEFRALSMQDLLERASTQNYVPVVDDKDAFIGIIPRRAIIKYCQQQLFPED